MSERTSRASRGQIGARILTLTAGVAALWCAGPPPASAQEDPAGTQEATWPAPRPEDVGSIDAILAAVYDVISGREGEARDWDRFRSLFIPEGRLIPGGTGQDGRAGYRVLSVEEYVRLAGSQLESQGFFENELGRVTERFGNVAHAFSSYASRRAPDDPEPFQRGVNSFQLWHDGGRWWIVSILWDWERPDNPVPERYLRP